MQEFDPYDPKVREAVIKFTETGAAADCPFCQGRTIASVSPGDRIVFLHDLYVGREAVVTNVREPREGEFLARLDGEETQNEVIVSYGHDAFAYTPISLVPCWLCGLSVDDLWAIDEAAMRVAWRLAIAPKKDLQADVLLPLIAVIRQRRLPIVTAELWATLAAHGFPKQLQRDFCSRFDFAIDVHVSMEGRPPIKKKRVPPMSIGRYQTPASAKYFGLSPGISAR